MGAARSWWECLKKMTFLKDPSLPTYFVSVLCSQGFLVDFDFLRICAWPDALLLSNQTNKETTGVPVGRAERQSWTQTSKQGVRCIRNIIATKIPCLPHLQVTETMLNVLFVHPEG